MTDYGLGVYVAALVVATIIVALGFAVAAVRVRDPVYRYVRGRDARNLEEKAYQVEDAPSVHRQFVTHTIRPWGGRGATMTRTHSIGRRCEWCAP